MARGAFWTIIVGEQPTAFRAPVREDLLPTLKQLQRQDPTATIKWFQRGRLWETPGDAMDAQKPPRRGATWRPGGEHKDPRDAYKVPRDVKRARWASQAADGRGPWVKGADRTPRNDRAPFGSAQGKPDTGRRAPEGRGERPAWTPKGDRPAGDRPYTPKGDRPAWKPRDDSRAPGDRPAFKPRADRPSGDRPAWKPKGDRPFTPRGDRPAGDRPAWKPKGERAPEGRGERTAWKPKGDRPAGDRPYTPKGDRPAWKPKSDRAPGTGFRAPEGKAERTGWKPKGDRPAFKPRTERPEGDGGGFKPKSDRPAWKPSGPGIRRGAPSGAPRGDWRDRGARGDATPRSGGNAPTPAPKRGKTWRVGELPPANRKKKIED